MPKRPSPTDESPPVKTLELPESTVGATLV